MPWTGETFQHHNHNLGIVQAAHAASIANAILRRTGDEGLAIRTANARAEHRDSGGVVDPSQGGIGGITPSTQTASPLMQGMIQRYSSLPVEKLQELSGMLGNSPQGQIVNHLLQQRRTMPNAAQPQARQQQAATATPGAAPVASVRRGGLVPHRDAGGGMGVSSSMADPWWTRQQASQDSRGGGFLQGSTPGRADALHTSAPAGAYILPADVVAGLGEGNSLAGARVWDTILRTGPHGIQQSPEHGGRGPPQAPRPAAMAGQAKGGGVHGDGSGKPTPVALSHGEIIVMPEDVKRFSQWFGGNGDLKHGHRILDAFVVYERRRQIKKLKSLPGPVGARKTA